MYSHLAMMSLKYKQIRNLHIILDTDLYFDSHINDTTRKCFIIYKLNKKLILRKKKKKDCQLAVKRGSPSQTVFSRV